MNKEYLLKHYQAKLQNLKELNTEAEGNYSKGFNDGTIEILTKIVADLETLQNEEELGYLGNDYY